MLVVFMGMCFTIYYVVNSGSIKYGRSYWQCCGVVNSDVIFFRYAVFYFIVGSAIPFHGKYCSVGSCRRKYWYGCRALRAIYLVGYSALCISYCAACSKNHHGFWKFSPVATAWTGSNKWIVVS